MTPKRPTDAPMKMMLHPDMVQAICKALSTHNLRQAQSVFRPGKQTLNRNAASPHCNQVILETFIAI